MATVDVTLEGRTFPVDTGFLVFNDRTYPRLVEMFDTLGVASVASEMSFSCRVDRAGLEWSGTDALSLFAQPANALRPAFWRMLADIARFNRATAMRTRNELWSISLGEYLDAEAFSAPFRDWYLLPMAAAIWSAPQRDILDCPLPTFVRFCHNHGLLRITDRPQWRTVAGGARTYVDKIVATLTDVRLATPVRHVTRHRDHVAIDARRARRRALRPGRACLSQRPGTAAVARRLTAGGSIAGRRALPAQPRGAAHRCGAAAARAPRVVGMELPGGRRRLG